MKETKESEEKDTEKDDSKKHPVWCFFFPKTNSNVRWFLYQIYPTGAKANGSNDSPAFDVMLEKAKLLK